MNLKTPSMNPFRQLAKATLNLVDKLEGKDREDAVASVLAQAVTVAENGWRRRIAKLEMPLTFSRNEVEDLSNAHHFMQIEMAKNLGLAILQNEAVCKLTREQTDSEVKFTASVALVPVADWGL